MSGTSPHISLGRSGIYLLHNALLEVLLTLSAFEYRIATAQS